jgi:hypothetical protein
MDSNIELQKRIAFLEGLIEGKQIAIDLLIDTVKQLRNNNNMSFDYITSTPYKPVWTTSTDPGQVSWQGGPVSGSVSNTITIDKDFFFDINRDTTPAVWTAGSIKSTLNSFLSK